MLSDYVKNDDLYKSYAFKICRCHDKKHDLVNEMYLKLDGIIKKNPLKKISNRFIFLMIRSIFIDGVRKKSEILLDEMPDIQQEEDVVLCQRITMDEVLGSMRFFDREILLKTQEQSLREIADEVGCSYVSVHNMKHKALDKLKKKWQQKNK